MAFTDFSINCFITQTLRLPVMKTMTSLLAAGLCLAALWHAQAQPASFKGEYSGLFLARDGFGVLESDHSGSFHLKVSDRGRIHGNFEIGNNRHSGSGEFDSQGHALFFIYVTRVDGDFSSTIEKTKRPKWMVTLDLVNDRAQVSGQIILIRPDGWWADLAGNRVGFDRETGAPPQAGLYTLIIPGKEGSGPAGTSYGTASVDSRGNLRFKGALADGKKISQGALLSRNGQWPMYASLYSDRGALAGWVTFANEAESDLSAEVEWLKPHQAAGPLYSDGFTNLSAVVGSRYVPPPAHGNVLGWTNGIVIIGGGNLTTPLTNNITIGPDNHVTVADGPLDSLTLTFRTTSGLFNGTFAHPTTGRNVKFAGVILQKQKRGAGFFPEAHVSGYVRLEEQ